MPDQLLLDLFTAYYDARQNKRNTINALKFEANYEQKLFELYDELKAGTYELGRSLAFVTFDPVQREVIASSFRDRVIHHLIFNYINPIFEAGFINDSYSCRVGRGTSYGIRRIAHFIRSCSDNYHQDCYILKLDLSGYFMSISHEILYDKIADKLKKKENYPFDCNFALSLIKKVIFHDYTTNCVIGCDPGHWQGLPKNKSLFHVPAGFGLPIGNLTSQLFSNIYLSGFDHFMKRDLKLEYYGRYVDDFIVVHRDKERLKTVILEARDYLSHLGLTLHPKKIYLQPYRRGVDFLGAIIKPYRIYLKNRTKGNFYKTISLINRDFKTENGNQNLPKTLASLNSYLGLMKNRQTYRLRRKALITKFTPEFWQAFNLTGGGG